MESMSISRLPDELLLTIFDYLDSAPPSELKKRQEPSLDLVKSTEQPLKAVSCVSKHWRRITLPLVFRYACLRLDGPWRPNWSTCPACSHASSRHLDEDDPRLHDIETYHADMVRAFQRRKVFQQTDTKPIVSEAWQSTTTESFDAPEETTTAAWAWRIYHVVQDFCQFVGTESLAASIRSISIVSGRMLRGKLGRFLHDSAPREWRYPASAALWQQLLSLITPSRVLIVAPPTELGCLTNASIDTFGDWAFGDMDYHILELRDDSGKANHLASPVDYADLQAFPRRHPSFAASSLIYLREWTHLSLNEGSFLRAYGTYEYFERGPPSLIYSIKQSLAPRHEYKILRPGIRALPALRSFTYTAIFPFADHAKFSEWLPYLEELDVQYAPNPNSGILDDKDRIGKAELQDCWQELLSAHNDIAAAVSTHRMSADRFPRLKRAVCRDYRIPMLQDELDEIFTPLCLPVWVEYQRGVFTRVAAELPAAS